jgi:hypothetical protein
MVTVLAYGQEMQSTAVPEHNDLIVQITDLKVRQVSLGQHCPCPENLAQSPDSAHQIALFELTNRIIP